jgi:DNA replication and repair protein RecF
MFLPYFQEFYGLIAEEREWVRLTYRSQLAEGNLAQMLKDNFRKDIVLQRTSAGIHKDDLEFTIADQPLKKFGSQGQQKTFLFALKLAQHQYLTEQKGYPPFLLLDDVCERLDEYRLQRLMVLLRNERFGQVFITDTSEERLRRFLPKGIAATFYPMS